MKHIRQHNKDKEEYEFKMLQHFFVYVQHNISLTFIIIFGQI